MKKPNKQLTDKTDVKILILYILDEINHPITYSSIIDAILDCGCEHGFGFDECFSELEELGHILSDTIEQETYYMIADSGSMVARELRSSLPADLLDRASVSAARHLTLAKMGVILHAKITPEEHDRFRVDFRIKNGENREMLTCGITVPTRDMAERIKAYSENARPEDIYRGVMTVLTGEINYYL